jgi:hypothetical protein
MSSLISLFRPPSPKKRQRFKLLKSLEKFEMAVLRLAITAIFLYGLYQFLAFTFHH